MHPDGLHEEGNHGKPFLLRYGRLQINFSSLQIRVRIQDTMDSAYR